MLVASRISLSRPAPPSIRSATVRKAPARMMSLPPLLLTVSLPSSVVILFSPELPMRMLLPMLPVALMAAVPVSVRFSTSAARMKLTELLTVSVPSPTFSTTTSSQ